MSATVITGIAELVTNDPAQDSDDLLGLREHAAVVVEDDRIVWVGDARDAPAADRRHDVDGAAVLPGFVDSHAHLMFDGDRSAEFAARMAGERYDGGGIATTVRDTRAASDERLSALLERRLAEMRAQGTTDGGGEVRIRADRRGRGPCAAYRATLHPGDHVPRAHVVPAEMDRAAYVDLVCGEMLTARRVRRSCAPAAMRGSNCACTGGQLAEGPGVQLAVELGAASVDHCTYLSSDDVAALADSSTVATVLPGVEFSTRSPYPDARGLIDAGVTVALATDCNPGTCYSDSMPLMIALAVREMGMTAAEAVWAATAGGARALRRDDVGVIRVGARADLTVLDAPSHRHLCYRPGVPLARALDV